jgi:hypothetical protein
LFDDIFKSSNEISNVEQMPEKFNNKEEPKKAKLKNNKTSGR